MTATARPRPPGPPTLEDLAGDASRRRSEQRVRIVLTIAATTSVVISVAIIGSLLGAVFGLLAGYVVYTVVDMVFGFRMDEEAEHIGADRSIHKISATPEDDIKGAR